MHYTLTVVRTKRVKTWLWGEIVRRDCIKPHEVAALLAEHPEWMTERDHQSGLIIRTGPPLNTTLCYMSECPLYIIRPTREAVGLLLQIAERLGGRVRGQGFETYRTPFDIYIHPDDEEQANSKQFTNHRKNRFRAMPWMRAAADGEVRPA